MGIKKGYVVSTLFGIFFFNQSYCNVIFISPKKIQKFLEWHGRHNRIVFDDDEGLLWSYASSQPDPWTLQDIYKKMCPGRSGMFYQDIIEKVQHIFDKVADKKKEQYEKVSLKTMDIKEVEQFLYSVLKVRNVPWSNYSDHEYPKIVIKHLLSKRKNDGVAFRCSEIKNGYDLIKKVCDVTTSYFDEKYLQKRLKKKYDISKEPELFLFMEKNQKTGSIDVVGLPGYSQDELEKDDDFFDAIMKAAIRASEKRKKEKQLFKIPYLVAGIFNWMRWPYKFRKINVKKLTKLLNKPFSPIDRPISNESALKYDDL